MRTEIELEIIMVQSPLSAPYQIQPAAIPAKSRTNMSSEISHAFFSLAIFTNYSSNESAVSKLPWWLTTVVKLNSILVIALAFVLAYSSAIVLNLFSRIQKGC